MLKIRYIRNLKKNNVCMKSILSIDIGRYVLSVLTSYVIAIIINDISI